MYTRANTRKYTLRLGLHFLVRVAMTRTLANGAKTISLRTHDDTHKMLSQLQRSNKDWQQRTHPLSRLYVTKILLLHVDVQSLVETTQSSFNYSVTVVISGTCSLPIFFFSCGMITHSE